LALAMTAGEWLTAAQVAALLRLNRKTIYRMLQSGEIACGRLPGGRYRIRAADLEQWLGHKCLEGRS
jgi:excisionase family DNA binding protein